MRDAALNAVLFDRLHGYASLMDDRGAAELALTEVYPWWAGDAEKPSRSVCNRARTLVAEALIDNARAGLLVVMDSPEQDSADVWSDAEREAAEALLGALCGPPEHGLVRAPEYVRTVQVETAVRVAAEMSEQGRAS